MRSGGAPRARNMTQALNVARVSFAQASDTLDSRQFAPYDVAVVKPHKSSGPTTKPADSWAGRCVRSIATSDWTRVVLVGLVIGAVTASTGGFGAGWRSILGNSAFWFGLVVVGIGLARLAALIVPRPWFETRMVSAACAMIAMIGPPMILVVAAANAVIFTRPFGLHLLGRVLPETLATTAGLTILSMMVIARTVTETHAATSAGRPVKFLGRLPAKLTGATLWAVEAEDHYLRLHTSAGQDLILMRLVDAVAELEGLEGARTHRSWWVAKDAVVSAERAEGRAMLTLPDGATAPVSRAYVRALRDAGWF